MTDTVFPVMTWAEVVDTCSRIHTTRRKPVFPWEPDGEMREASEMIDVWIDTGDAVRPAQIVPTRMHEPGFYWRYVDGETTRTDEAPELRALVDAGHVYLVDPTKEQVPVGWVSDAETLFKQCLATQPVKCSISRTHVEDAQPERVNEKDYGGGHGSDD